MAIGILILMQMEKSSAQGDFFDYGGMMQAVGPKNPVLVTLKFCQVKNKR